MLLTSLNRVKLSLGIGSSDQDLILSRLIGTVSGRIRSYLRRRMADGADALQYLARTEYLNPRPDQAAFYLAPYPIGTITSVYVDGSALYTGQEQLVPSTDYYVAPDLRMLVFAYGLSRYVSSGDRLFTVPKSLRVIHTSGLAADAAISAWTKGADAGGTIAVNQYVVGQTSGFQGRVTATSGAASGTLSYENFFGKPTPGETLDVYGDYDFSRQNGGPKNKQEGLTTTLTALTSECMTEKYPDLVEAAEMAVHFMYTNRDKFDSMVIQREGETRASRSDLQKDYTFLPEVRDILETYRNRLVA